MQLVSSNTVFFISWLVVFSDLVVLRLWGLWSYAAKPPSVPNTVEPQYLLGNAKKVHGILAVLDMHSSHHSTAKPFQLLSSFNTLKCALQSTSEA